MLEHMSAVSLLCETGVTHVKYRATNPRFRHFTLLLLSHGAL